MINNIYLLRLRVLTLQNYVKTKRVVATPIYIITYVYSSEHLKYFKGNNIHKMQIYGQLVIFSIICLRSNLC